MSAERPLQGLRVLVLEDDFYLASDEKALLERAGASVVGPFGAACAEHDLPESGAVDAALVDINLGQGPSFGFARLLASRGIPLVFLTGYDAGVVPPDLGHVRRLEKPVRDSELIDALSALANSRR